MAASERIVLAVAALAAAVLAMSAGDAPPRAADLSVPPPGQNFGMLRYVDRAHGFSFWYPRALSIAVHDENDTQSFLGGVMVQTLHVEASGTLALHVVRSPQSTITDEADGHAAPIPQTKYFYDAAAGRWMVA